MGVECVRRPAWNVANVIIRLQHAKYIHVGTLLTHTHTGVAGDKQTRKMSHVKALPSLPD